MQTYTIDIRPRRQATLPRELLEKLGVDVGDKLEADVEGKKMVLKAKKQIALDALAEIQRIVRESGVSEAELQREARLYRERMAKKRWS